MSQIWCVRWEEHDFREEYYGYKCTKCNMFFAYGCALWEELPDPDYDEDLL